MRNTHSLGRLKSEKANAVVNDKKISVSVWTLVANMADFGLAVIRSSGWGGEGPTVGVSFVFAV
jgi:hypothetical protein